MRAVVQRVKEASVKVDGKITGQINKGLLVLAGIHTDDEWDQIQWVSDKIARLRIFEDDEGKMNKSVEDVGGDLLIVSQFTLYGSVKKGTRPSFIESARPEKAEPMYDKMVEYLRENYPMKVETGVFAAMMDVQLINDGPVTIIVEK